MSRKVGKEVNRSTDEQAKELKERLMEPCYTVRTNVEEAKTTPLQI